MSISVTTWYLEQTSPADLSPAGEPPAEQDLRIVRSEVTSPEFSRFLHTAVGRHVNWTDRLTWSYAQWAAHLGRPGVETWVAYEHGTPAGFIELAAEADGSVEIVYFGLVPDFQGRRIGGHLLTYGTERAWDLAERWPDLARTKRVWLHTCSQDGPHAKANYERRGFRVYKTTVTEEPDVTAPGPWPGAGPTTAGAPAGE
ncbi:GNAT family N-acetyltransferase [Streptomyces caniferus]|uniref:GNAT family N-acetyltransferase n=1 Tax=Streptomyces caniferus TaxID=285557 RepID=UPI002E2907F7|nr:GNAT family N-acetyltransferase [Streptomyces caniferus]